MKVVIIFAVFTFAYTFALPHGGGGIIPGLPALPPLVFEGGLCEPLGSVQPSTIPTGLTCICKSTDLYFGAIYTWGNCTTTPTTTTTTTTVAPTTSSSTSAP